MTNSKNTLLLLFAILACTSTSIWAKSKKNKTKVEAPQLAPWFETKDVNGKSVRLENFKGKKVLLTFYRNVGCPVCNQRFHELQEQAKFYESKGLILLAVYESSAENMKKYLENESFYATMIPNSDLSLYELYSVEKGMGKVMKGMFRGAMGKMKQGKKQFSQKIKQDGSTTRVSADFLIDENGKIHTAYYGSYIGDHLPINQIATFLN